MIERKPKIGDRIKLLINRGVNKIEDILNIEYIHGSTLVTKEMFNSVEKHHISINHYNKQWVYAEESFYEIY